jgi:hypothetical protein
MATSGYLSEHAEAFSKGNHFKPDGKNSGDEFTDLLVRSLALYLSIEKLHWHLRLNIGCSPGQSGVCAELAREASSESLRLIRRVSRLQQALQPTIVVELEELLAALSERQLQNIELAPRSP